MGELVDEAGELAAVAARHGRDPREVLLTAGAAQGFVLLAQALRDSRRPVVVHPQFTEPEAALAHAGHRVERVLLSADDGFRLDPALVPEDADLVFVARELLREPYWALKAQQELGAEGSWPISYGYAIKRRAK